MQQIIIFLIKNSYKLLFLLLLGISLTLTIKSHSYHRSQYINSSNAFSGYTYSKINNVKEYFGLQQKNEDLARENARLKEILFNKKDTILESRIVVPNILSDFVVRQAKVIKNSYTKQENFLTLSKGSFEGLKTDMAVISDKGVVGIIEKTSKNFATVISILHTKNPLNGKIKNSDWLWTDKEDTEEERVHNKKIFTRAREIEESEWKELWSIIQGQDIKDYSSKNQKIKDSEPHDDADSYNDWFDGSGLRGWWD